MKGGGDLATGNRKKTERTAAQIAAQFKPGQSGNPKGRPKNDPSVTAMFNGACPDAVKLLITTMHDENVKPELRVECAKTIINRVMGKELQPIQADVFQAKEPLTLDECFAIAEEVLKDAGGPTAP